MCSDGASVNVKLHRLVQKELGAHLYTGFVPFTQSGDSFKLSELNSQCQEDVTNVYYLFKKATL